MKNFLKKILKVAIIGNLLNAPVAAICYFYIPNTIGTVLMLYTGTVIGYLLMRDDPE